MPQIPQIDHASTNPAADLCDYLANTPEDLGFIDPSTVAIAADYMTLAADGRGRLIKALEDEDIPTLNNWRWQSIAWAARATVGANPAVCTALWSVVDHLSDYPGYLVLMIHAHLERQR